MQARPNQSRFFDTGYQLNFINRLSITELREYIARNPLDDLTLFDAALKTKIGVLLNPLLQAVAYGQQNAAEQLLKTNPWLLFETSTVVDYSGRTIEGSPYQVALGAEDTEMLKMMQSFIKTDEDHVVAAKQFSKQFPNGIHDTSSDYDFSALIAAISADEQLKMTGVANATTEALLEKFRQDFTPTGVIKTGIHFNMQHLVKAHHFQRKTLPLWNDYQQDLFWKKVIGYLQRSAPACYAQAFCEGPLRLLTYGKPSCRSFNLSSVPHRICAYSQPITNIIQYYPIDLHSQSGLGFEFAVTFTTNMIGKAGPGVAYDRSFSEDGNWLTERINEFVNEVSTYKPDLLLQRLCQTKREKLKEFYTEEMKSLYKLNRPSS